MTKTKKLGSSPNALVTISLTIALLLIGLCGLITLNARKLAQLIKENNEVRVYLFDDLSQAQMDSTFKVIAAQPFVLKNGNSPAISFISKESAAKEVMGDTDIDYRKMLSNNPFHNLYTVKVKEDYFQETKLKEIKQVLEKVNHVHDVSFVENVVEDINKQISKVYLILSVFVLLLLFVIFLMVNNTIKLALYSQRFLIRSMQLVGATNNFIRRPFIKNGLLQGLIAAFIACALLVLVQQIAIQKIEGLIMLQEPSKLIGLVIVIIILGGLIGTISTYQSIERYLKLSLDDLY
jgi:cell division transport system permease protein